MSSTPSQRSQTKPSEFFRTRATPPAPVGARAFDPDATIPLGMQRTAPGTFDPECTIPLGMRSAIAAFDPEATMLDRDARQPRAFPAPDFDALPHDAYTIRAGDTLSTIAVACYGSPIRWTEIFASNRDRLSHPAKLPVGTEIRIPRP